MKISKKVGRMALEYIGKTWQDILDMGSPFKLEVVMRSMGWGWPPASGLFEADYRSHFDTLMCLIASIAGVKPEDLE